MGALGWGMAAVPALCVAYGLFEARLFRLRRLRIRLLPEGTPSITILQVSDLHLRMSTRRLAAFLESLSGTSYDLVFATGDLLGEPQAVERCAELLNGLDARAGRFFVFGSSDYYAPTFKNYLDYFTRRRRPGTRRNRTDDFREALTCQGWKEINNHTEYLDLKGLRIQITGLDDPYLHRDNRSLLTRSPDAGLAFLVVHDPSPYHEAAKAGFDLVVAGHTHGGQVRFPLIGAVVTNSDIPRSLARGLHRVERSWLHVSPGLGTGRYAPFRFMCPPEASVLELVAR